MPLIDIAGQRFGRLTALERGPMVDAERGRARARSTWICRCDCGVVISIRQTNLRSPSGTRSCGCLAREIRGTLTRTHGATNTPEWAAWKSARDRCFSPRCRSFIRYGARGITMCAEWRQSFEAFRRDVGLRPSPCHSLDRIDNAGNYEPGNVRWATKKQQSANTRRTLRVTILGGESVSLKDLARRSGVNYGALWARVKAGQDAIVAAASLRPHTL